MSYESMIREGENEVDIVIIDDEPKIRNGLRHFLDKQEGWSVTGAFENAVDALAFLSHHDADAVITDIKMPEMNGLSILYPDYIRAVFCLDLHHIDIYDFNGLVKTLSELPNSGYWQ